VNGKYTIWLFVILAIGVPAGAFTAYNFYERKFSKLPVMGPQEKINGVIKYHSIDEFEFVSQEGKTFAGSDWDERIVVADFFFTTCPTICPAMTANLKRIQQSFAENEIFINSFSVDPERDSVSRLDWYARRFQINGGNWKLLTGEKKDIYRLARNSFRVVATDGDGGEGDFIHSEKLVLIDKQKRIRGYYDGTSEKETNKLIADIKKLQHEK